jgi:hypothetical protein
MSSANVKKVVNEKDYRPTTTMRITDVKTQIVNLDFRNAVIVKVETDAGISGMSETTMKRKTLSIEQSILELKRYLVGKDPTEIENHWEKMYRDSFWVGGAMHSTAISAIDCALWDILAKSCSLPVHKLLGGPTRTRVPVYCHCPAGSSPEEFARNLKLCQKRGYSAAKTTLPLFYGSADSEGKASSNGVPRDRIPGCIDMDPDRRVFYRCTRSGRPGYGACRGLSRTLELEELHPALSSARGSESDLCGRAGAAGKR